MPRPPEVLREPVASVDIDDARDASLGIGAAAPWPALPLPAWQDTYDTLHLWTQVVGKVRLVPAPMVNHWWQVPLYVSARGLTTSPIPYRHDVVEVTFDFRDDVLRLDTSGGASRTVALVPRSVADFYGESMAALASVGVDVRIRLRPVERSDVMPFDEATIHATYDRDAAHRCWCALVQVSRVLGEFRGRFTGKCSAVQFWWGSFDIACTRFSGRRAPPHPGGVPNLADYVAREAYSHECMSAGWWPGGGAVLEPAFYAYAYPEPAGCLTAEIQPPAAYYHPVLREWILPYDAVRSAVDPDAAILAFLESTYSVVARLGARDRQMLERVNSTR